MFNQLRVIPLDGRRPPIDGRMGQSSGHWEGDTLVVETTGVTEPFRLARGSAFVVTPQTKIMERFSRAGAQSLRYTFTVEDSLIYSRPWTAELLMTATTDPMFEFACHEGNYALANILSGGRMVERRAAAATTISAKTSPAP
jgi:hypothetical protein